MNDDGIEEKKIHSFSQNDNFEPTICVGGLKNTDFLATFCEKLEWRMIDLDQHPASTRLVSIIQPIR